MTMRVDGINRIEAKEEKILVDKNTVKDFVLMTNRRDIRTGKVNTLYRILEQGKHFETPLVTSRRIQREFVLDGNHRLEALYKYFSKFPQRKVELFIFYYENLTPEEEKAKYTIWNSGTKQNTNDFVKQYWDTIPIIRKFRNGFPYPVSHCWTGNAIEFKTLIGAYLTKEDTNFAGGFQGTAMEFIKKSQQLVDSDANEIKAFLNEMIAVYGLPNKANPHYKQAVFYSIMRIWLDNRINKNPAQMKKAMHKIKNSTTVNEFSSLGGTRENCKLCRKFLLDKINGRKSTNCFV